MYLPKDVIKDDNCINSFFDREHLSANFSEPFISYLLYGWAPGSAFSGILRNDFFDAILSSHPSNTIDAYKAISRIIINYFPKESYGSDENVEMWKSLSNEQRRQILEDTGLVKSPLQILKDA